MAKPTKSQLSEAARVLKSGTSTPAQRIEAAQVLAASGGGKKGGTNRAKNLTAAQRSDIARMGGQARQEQRRAQRDLKAAQNKMDALKKGTKKSAQKAAPSNAATKNIATKSAATKSAVSRSTPAKVAAKKAAAKKAPTKAAKAPKKSSRKS